MSVLEAAAVEAALRDLGSAFGAPVSVARETGSTNDDARSAAAAGAPHGASFFADAQTRGRGRSGHAWHSPPGENLYVSVVTRPRGPAASLPPLALVVGLAVADVVDAALGEPGRARVKWPNDVLVDEKKIAGVLVEAQIRGDAVASVIVGVGLNVLARAFPPEVAGRATSLALLGAPAPRLDRARVAAELLASIGRRLDAYERDPRVAPLLEGPAGLAARDALRGEQVVTAEGEGTCDGIDATGALVVRSADGRAARVTSGSVTVVDPGLSAPKTPR